MSRQRLQSSAEAPGRSKCMLHLFILALCACPHGLLAEGTTDEYGTTGSYGSGVPAQSYIRLSGSGSTLLSKFIWRIQTLIEARTKPAVMLNYRAIGSGGGISELGAAGSVLASSAVQNHFAASDVPLSAGQNPMVDGVPTFLHFPAAIAAVGVYVNVPIGLSGFTLNTSQCLLNDIFGGRCTTWDCQPILDLNPNFFPPPGITIQVGIRADRSGTSSVLSSWLKGSTAACAQVEGPPGGHPFGAGEQLFRGGAHFYDGAPVAPGVGNVPANVHLAAGTAGVLSFLLSNPWSIVYSDSGQAISAGAQEVAILNPTGLFLRSFDDFASAPSSSLPYPDGSTAAGGPPSNSAWPAVSLFDSTAVGAFPLVTLTYLIMPSSLQRGAFNAESVAILLALLQYMYYPEVTHGYNASCGYSSSGSLILDSGAAGILPAHACDGYYPAGILASFQYVTVPASWMGAVLPALAAAAASGSLRLATGGRAIQLFSGAVGNVTVPRWSLEATERSLGLSSSSAGGSAERVISYNRMSFADFERTQNAEKIAANAAKLATLQGEVYGATPAALGDRSIVYRLSGSGASLQSKLIWRAMDLLMRRTRLPVRMTYRSIGSGAGTSEFVGDNNGYSPWTHFGASDSVMPTDCPSGGRPPCPSYTALTGPQFGNQQVLTIPTAVVMIGVFHSVPVASLPAGRQINLTASVVCQIFSGAITTWDHASIRALNPGMRNLPANQPITVVTRQDSSGTTRVFSGWMAATCGSLFSPASGSVVQWPPTARVAPQTGSSGVTSYMMPNPVNLSQVTYRNPWAIAYVDSGFGKDSGLTEVALELAVGTGVFAGSTALGAAGISAPAGGYPPSSYANWALNDPQRRLFNQWQGGNSQPIFPILSLSYIFLRGDMSAFGEAGRLAVALVQFLLSADAGTPAGAAAESPASPLKFYGDFLMAQPPQGLIAQALEDLKQVKFAPGAPEEWAFESYFAAPGSPASGYLPYAGSGDRVFSAWRNDQSDYSRTSNAQQIIAEAHDAALQLQQLSVTITSVQALQSSVQQLQGQIALLQGQLAQVQLAAKANPSSDGPGEDEETSRVAVAALVFAVVVAALAAAAAGFHFFVQKRRAGPPASEAQHAPATGSKRVTGAHPLLSPAAHASAAL